MGVSIWWMKKVYRSGSYGSFGGGGSRFGGASVSKWMLVILVVVFLVDVIGRGSSEGRLSVYFSMKRGDLLEIWRWGSYPLVNVNLGDWLFTLIAFFVFGPMAERSLGSRRFGVMLVMTTLVGAIVYALLSSGSVVPLSGAGGLAMALLVVVALRYPDQKVRLLLPPVTLSLKTLGYGLIGLLVVMSIAQRADPAESLAHLSGVGVGFLCLKNLSWLDVGVGSIGKKGVGSDVGVQKRKVAKTGGRMRARTELNMKVSKSEAEVNRILDKVSEEGIGNLSDDEREILKFASKK